jgi:hypothetical protein
MADISRAPAAGGSQRRPLSRRRVLAVAGIIAAAAVSGCTRNSSDGTAPDRPSVDATARDRILDDKAALLAVYAATIERHPTLRRPLDGFVRRHTAHIDALRRALAATPTNSATTTRRPHQAQIPPQRSMAVRALADAEQAATERRRSVVESALSGTFAALVASIAACENAHALLLRAEADR